ncbi:condensation domain-containing protein [Actinosynnema sp. NPDC047251]|uniref:Non-ribosomal peptide synthase-modules containing protein n=1 Tax=Saccharothrix espanaensis (strain ATCC 51144 / DSM 44229 / JCM 9112 / NBRC 15066 / NRRL 15764) TaxID=1179773 RepID=K0JVK9_SACES|nr:condensation domain-containing protein [Saccharothrix espanaensis]CCH30006.1 Non-ribosomal peptide synthase-modules containing protein [Saccharothrix espanaensis DSM 44229]
MTATLPLSAAQTSIWFGQQLDPANPVYNTADYVLVEGPVEPERMERAVRAAVAEAESLHARFALEGDEPRQRHEPRDWPFPVLDLSAEPDPPAAAEAWMRADVRTPVDLAEGPLFAQALLKLADDRWIWHQRVHHIAVDGYAFSLLARRVADLYTDGGGTAFGPFAKVLATEASYVDSGKPAVDGGFWRDYLADLPEPPGLVDRLAGIGDHTVRATAQVPAEALRALATQENVGWPDVVTAAVAGYLHRATGADEVVLGLPVMGRLGTPLLRVPSIVMNIVPLRIPVSSGDTLPALAREVAAQVKRTRPHQRYRHEQIRRDLSLVGGNRKLFGPVVNVMPFDNDLRFDGHRGRMRNLAAGPVEDLAVGVRDFSDGSGLSVELDGNPALYDERTLVRHRDRLLRLLDEGVRVSDRPIGRIPLADRVVPRREPLPPAPDVVDLIRRRAAERPDAIAVEQGDARLTYAELVAEADRLAGRLRERGAGPDVLVSLQSRRRPETIAALLGVLFAGAAYVPLDPDAPEERTRAVLEAANPPIRITDVISGRTQPVAGQARPGNLAYVVHTSGSTGRPNGVLVTREALAGFVRAAGERYGITAEDRVLQFAALHFDASVEEVFVTLCAGAALVLRSDEMTASIGGFLRACDESRVTFLDLPTAFWHEVAHAVDGGEELPRSVRAVVIGGEAALATRVAQWRATGVSLINTYGPTEATVVATAADLCA